MTLHINTMLSLAIITLLKEVLFKNEINAFESNQSINTIVISEKLVFCEVNVPGATAVQIIGTCETGIVFTMIHEGELHTWQSTPRFFESIDKGEDEAVEVMHKCFFQLIRWHLEYDGISAEFEQHIETLGLSILPKNPGDWVKLL